MFSGEDIVFTTGSGTDAPTQTTINIKDLSLAELGLTDDAPDADNGAVADKIDGTLTAADVQYLSSSVTMDAIQLNISNRAELGAFQNRLNYIVDNMQTLSNNLADSYSRIIDTDYASETAKLTRGQILQQAATSMLAQANQMPNVILTLLK
jgi:flagellin